MSAKGFVEIDVQEWSELMSKISVLEADVKEMKTNHLPHIYGELKAIREKMSSYRPPWSIVAIITVLSSLCVALIVHAIF